MGQLAAIDAPFHEIYMEIRLQSRDARRDLATYQLVEQVASFTNGYSDHGRRPKLRWTSGPKLLWRR